MRILITGAAGFLGSHICDRLISMGNEIIGMDNFITGNQQNLAHLSGNPLFNLGGSDNRNNSPFLNQTHNSSVWSGSGANRSVWTGEKPQPQRKKRKNKGRGKSITINY